MSNKWTLEDVERKGLKVSGDKIYQNDKKYSTKEVKNIPASFALGRMKGRKMNKTEAAYAKYLDTQKKFGDVLEYWFEDINIRLADKCFYKIDFLLLLKNAQLECHEVKGFWTDDALVKIKAAAAKFPFRFISVRLVKGDWEIREF